MGFQESDAVEPGRCFAAFTRAVPKVGLSQNRGAAIRGKTTREWILLRPSEVSGSDTAVLVFFGFRPIQFSSTIGSSKRTRPSFYLEAEPNMTGHVYASLRW